jgi:hypothetical protein
MSIKTPVQEDPFLSQLIDSTDLTNTFVYEDTYSMKCKTLTCQDILAHNKQVISVVIVILAVWD